MRVDDVLAWRDRLLKQRPPPSHLSPAGAAAVWSASLNAVTADAMARLTPRAAYDTAVLVCARTVLTAPIEWCAVLLARGTSVVLKIPHNSLGWTSAYVNAAQALGLPLTCTTDRSVVRDADLVVAMGTDDTMHAIETSVRGRFIALGHRFSVAFVHDDFAGVAQDAAFHDGRGCFSPVLVFSPRPDAADRMAGAMATAQQRWPVGERSPIEGATGRARGALARVVGRELRSDEWSVHQLPRHHAEPVALPRSVVVVISDIQAAVNTLRPWSLWLSCVATDGDGAPWGTLNPSRIVSPGRLQSPQLHRIHDGIDWVAATRP